MQINLVNEVITNVNSRHLQICDQLDKINLYLLKSFVGGREIEVIVDSSTEI